MRCSSRSSREWQGSRFRHPLPRNHCRIATIAGTMWILEVGAAGALHQVSADRRHIAQLGRCAGHSASATIGKERAKSGSCARSAFLTRAPIRMPPLGSVSMRSRSGKRLMSISFAGRIAPVFHQIDEVCAAAEIGGAGLPRGNCLGSSSRDGCNRRGSCGFPRRLGCHAADCVQNSFGDAVIGGTAAEIAAHAFTNALRVVSA